ncbi:FAD-dependent monooxygenase [Rhodococcus cerastii]|nr:FAD-dependent monooxygenase [Rhodococcus cerastii]
MSEVTIVGGGICGLTLAIAATMRGHQVTVYERREPQAATRDGAYLTVSGKALADLDRLGVGERMRGLGIEVRSASLTTDGNTRRRPFPLVDGIGHHHFWRRDLLTALTERCLDVGATLVHLAHAVLVDKTRTSARLHLSGGRDISSDVLIGCDGLSSTVRRDIIAGPTTPTYEGQVVLYGHHLGIHSRALEERELSFFRHRGNTFGALDGGRHGTFWFARLTRPALTPSELGLHTSQRWKAELATAFPSSIVDLAAFVDSTPLLFACNAERVPDLPTWGDQRALVLGDAAHGMSPAAGQGATLAIADALTAAALLDPRTPKSVFTAAIAARRLAADAARSIPTSKPTATSQAGN